MDSSHLPDCGTWIQTESGLALDLIAPDPRAIDPSDLAVGLARQPRFCGHTDIHREAWNVAEHSILVAGLARRMGFTRRIVAFALLHDGHEAFTGDHTSPYKVAIRRLLAELGVDGSEFPLERVARTIQHAIHTRFDLPHPTHQEAHAIKHCDLMALALETRQLMAPTPAARKWVELPEPPDGIRLQPRCGQASRIRFLAELDATLADVREAPEADTFMWGDLS